MGSDCGVLEGDQITMAPSPLAVKRRREAERPPVILPPTKSHTDAKDKKKTSSGPSLSSKILEYVYFLVGFVWYSLVSLWRRPADHQLEATVTVTKALFTPSEFVVRIQRSEQSFGSNPPQKLSNQKLAPKMDGAQVGGRYPTNYAHVPHQ